MRNFITMKDPVPCTAEPIIPLSARTWCVRRQTLSARTSCVPRAGPGTGIQTLVTSNKVVVSKIILYISKTICILTAGFQCCPERYHLCGDSIYTRCYNSTSQAAGGGEEVDCSCEINKKVSTLSCL